MEIALFSWLHPRFSSVQHGSSSSTFFFLFLFFFGPIPNLPLSPRPIHSPSVCRKCNGWMAEETTCKCQFRPSALSSFARNTSALLSNQGFSCRLQSRASVRCHSYSYFLCPVGRKGGLWVFLYPPPFIRSPLHSCEDLEWYLVVKWLWLWAGLGLDLLLPLFFSSFAFSFSSLHLPFLLLLSHFSISITFFFFFYLLFLLPSPFLFPLPPFSCIQLYSHLTYIFTHMELLYMDGRHISI